MEDRAGGREGASGTSGVGRSTASFWGLVGVAFVSGVINLFALFPVFGHLGELPVILGRRHGLPLAGQAALLTPLLCLPLLVALPGWRLGRKLLAVARATEATRGVSAAMLGAPGVVSEVAVGELVGRNRRRSGALFGLVLHGTAVVLNTAILVLIFIVTVRGR